MKKFLDENFMLDSETAVRLYNDFAADMPIIDYHCHINPKEIWEDVRYDNITQLWLYGDHYKWRAMRTCGIDEKYITGSASDYEKFYAYAMTLEQAIGNPLYHWSHMELKKYFGYEGILNSKTAETVWKHCNEILQKGLSVRKIIELSNVEVICTTDDPIDDLRWHRLIAEKANMRAKVLPAWRPDKLVNIGKSGFCEYLSKLSKLCGIKITNTANLKKAICMRLDFFEENGCSVSDHGLDFVPFNPCDEAEAGSILQKVMDGEVADESEIEKYMTFMMDFLAKEYSERDWIMQLHYGCRRNLNTTAFRIMGPDTGYDSISSYTPSEKLIRFMDSVNIRYGLPKTILYSLNPSDNAVIDSVIGAFQEGAPGKIQHGSAWWFNDNKDGMRQQMISLANLGVLGCFVGMLTDSRSFLSYTRHDYFRRIMCSLIGGWVETGEYPADFDTLSKIVKGISHDNAEKYFNFK